MEIKQYHIYSLKNDLLESVTSHVIVIQNDKANKVSEWIVVVPYVNKEFKGVHTVRKESLMEEIGIFPEEKRQDLKNYYYSFITC